MGDGDGRRPIAAGAGGVAPSARPRGGAAGTCFECSPKLTSRLVALALLPLILSTALFPLPPFNPEPCSCSRDDIMTLPANDAFTLGLPHDPARIGLRSSSKIPFVSGSKPRSPSATSRRSAPPRQMSVDLPDSPSLRDSRSPPPHPNSPPHSFPSSNGPLNGSALRHRKKPRTTPAIPSSQLLANRTNQKSPRPPVDWEIPRKTLHSSIGTFSSLA